MTAAGGSGCVRRGGTVPLVTAATALLELTAHGPEGVTDGDPRVGVHRPLVRGAADDHMSAWNTDLHDHPIEASPPLVAVRQLDGYPAAHDTVERPLELVDLPLDQSFEARAGEEPLKGDARWDSGRHRCHSISGAAAGAGFGSGSSVSVASVSRRTLATETAFSSAIRTTLVGSMIPASTKST